MDDVTDAVHRRGCRGENARPSTLLKGYVYCPDCRRTVRDALASDGGAS